MSVFFPVLKGFVHLYQSSQGYFPSERRCARQEKVVFPTGHGRSESESRVFTNAMKGIVFGRRAYRDSESWNFAGRWGVFALCLLVAMGAYAEALPVDAVEEYSNEEVPDGWLLHILKSQGWVPTEASSDIYT